MRYLLLCLVCLSAEAQAPSLDQLAAAYAGAPWFMSTDDTGNQYVCIAEAHSRYVDRIVSLIADRAKGAHCS